MKFGKDFKKAELHPASGKRWFAIPTLEKGVKAFQKLIMKDTLKK
jgi:hypothetical protein